MPKQTSVCDWQRRKPPGAPTSEPPVSASIPGPPVDLTRPDSPVTARSAPPRHPDGATGTDRPHTATVSHRSISANGIRFHLAEAGTGPLVLLLHGFGGLWSNWRHQLTGLSAAGFHAVAADLRGSGETDKPPRGYDAFTLSADVAGMIRALGERDATLVGQGYGGVTRLQHRRDVPGPGPIRRRDRCTASEPDGQASSPRPHRSVRTTADVRLVAHLPRPSARRGRRSHARTHRQVARRAGLGSIGGLCRDGGGDA